MPFAFVILTHQQLVKLLCLGVLEQLDPAHVVGISHVLVQPTDCIAAVLGLYNLTKDVDVAARFSHEGVTSALEN